MNDSTGPTMFRKTTRLPRRVLLMAAAALGIGLGASAIALATIPDPSGLIHTCYKKPGDTLRLADDSGGCAKDEVLLSWLALRGFYTLQTSSIIGPTPPGQARGGTTFCPFGDHAIGGGFDVFPSVGMTGLSVVSSHRVIEEDVEGWELLFTNTSSEDIQVVRQVVCADVTP